jgi:hypothetical protein
MTVSFRYLFWTNGQKHFRLLGKLSYDMMINFMDITATELYHTHWLLCFQEERRNPPTSHQCTPTHLTSQSAHANSSNLPIGMRPLQSIIHWLATTPIIQATCPASTPSYIICLALDLLFHCVRSCNLPSPTLSHLGQQGLASHIPLHTISTES